MKVGIIGAGRVGGTLTRRLSALGHDVQVANSRGPDTLTELATESGAVASDVRHVADDAELVIIAVPQKAVPRLPDDLLVRAAPTVVVVDADNYYPQRDGVIPEIEEGLTESEWVSRQLGVPVVKAFNTITAYNLMNGGLPHGAPGRIALPVAGDDMAAKAVVSVVIDSLGFDPIDAGPLYESWRQEPGSPCYGAEADPDMLRRLLAQAERAAARH